MAVQIISGRKINDIPLVANLVLSPGFNNRIRGKCIIDPTKDLNSLLAKQARVNDETFASILFNFDKESLDLQNFKVIINDPEYRPLATEEEMKSMKGLGKILLVKTLNFLLSQEYITLDTVIELDANPFLSCNFSMEPGLFEKYNELSDDTCMKRLREYPKILKNFKDILAFVKNKREILLKYVCVIDQLLNLVDYYKRLGFTPTIEKHDYDLSVHMISRVRGVVS